ncbi:hypothetical protein [Proteus mirabilis]|uniref:hypothetical protein n=1 Tax=Proteus mirabilis TaxID=584 RepID=UPI0019D1E12E|nr:hypothetical protein [Proteus mirabilis]ELL8911809.1 hypothetical protein [Proteus mirabilis]MBN7190032.1 hypothetical protein [Proteus mirabilis]MBN7244172.1 hypothetical protein [Proteus mirabilis]HCU2505520.1 hypothetical protein [Proteus mirabilis]HEJ9544752.1 hypothetical protein [Proteus mirabilis]
MNTIYLPLYSDRNNTVYPQSGLNAWNASSKNPNSSNPKPRPADEIYIPIPIIVHQKVPSFFGFDALDKNQRDATINKFNLYYSNSNYWKAIITEDNGKALETDPQSDLGEWILRDVLNLPYGTVLTMDMLNEKKIDSVKITKVDSGFRIEIAPFNAFRNWKATL